MIDVLAVRALDVKAQKKLGLSASGGVGVQARQR